MKIKKLYQLRKNIDHNIGIILNSTNSLNQQIEEQLEAGVTIPNLPAVNPYEEKARYLYTTKINFAEQRASMINDGSLPLAIPQGDIKTSQQIIMEKNTDCILLGEILAGSEGVIEMAKNTKDRENMKKIKNATKRRSLISAANTQ